MRTKRILILGGTADARDLANQLVAKGYDVTTSLAGVTTRPVLPRGSVRRGGFGGSEGLAAFCRDAPIDLIVDGTHPFARQISAHAVSAANEACIACLRLERHPWQPGDDDNWLFASSIADAVLKTPQGSRVFLTIGRKYIEPFMERADLSGVARMIEPPEVPLARNWILNLDRPPFSSESELALLRKQEIDVLVCKNSGGEMTAAKLEAARIAGIAVIMIERPQKPQVPAALTVPEMLALVEKTLAL